MCSAVEESRVTVMSVNGCVDLHVGLTLYLTSNKPHGGNQLGKCKCNGENSVLAPILKGHNQNH